MNRKRFLRLLGAGAAGMAGTSMLPGGPALSGFRQPGWAEKTKNWAWMGGTDWTVEGWARHFAKMRAAGIDALLLNAGIGNRSEIIAAARREGLEVHIWKFTMMQSVHQDAHPEWYAVSRKGVSTAQQPPYVAYYKFMCPTRQPVRRQLEKQIRELARLKGVAGVHLDYIRYPDVILPVALWPKYNLVQDKEYPEFDFCYCEVCRSTFKEQTGLDPLELPDPPANAAWKQFRYDSISRVVNSLAAIVREEGKQLTAAVFPTPQIARKLVRQDWARWDLDAVMPMIYHSFYKEEVAWVETATRQGVEALAGKIPLYSGLYVPELDPAQLARAARHALDGGAQGIVLFEGKTLTEKHWSELAAVYRMRQN
ncbi:MAG: hypothetical protein V3T83_12930 [Acidobacteriota bacterium]